MLVDKVVMCLQKVAVYLNCDVDGRVLCNSGDGVDLRCSYSKVVRALAWTVDGQTISARKIRNDEMVPTSADYRRRIARSIAIRPLQLPPRHM